MIVRIAGEGRWRLVDEFVAQLRADDMRLMRAVDEGREDEYQCLLVALCRFVRAHGRQLQMRDRRGEADFTIPSPQMSLAEIADLLDESPGI